MAWIVSTSSCGMPSSNSDSLRPSSDSTPCWGMGVAEVMPGGRGVAKWMPGGRGVVKSMPEGSKPDGIGSGLGE